MQVNYRLRPWSNLLLLRPKLPLLFLKRSVFGCISLCTLHSALHWRNKCWLTNIFASCGLQIWSDYCARQGRPLVAPYDFPQQQASCLSYPHFVCADNQKAFAKLWTQLFVALAHGSSSMQTCLRHQKCASPCRSAKHTALHISDSS